MWKIDVEKHRKDVALGAFSRQDVKRLTLGAAGGTGQQDVQDVVVGGGVRVLPGGQDGVPGGRGRAEGGAQHVPAGAHQDAPAPVDLAVPDAQQPARPQELETPLRAEQLCQDRPLLVPDLLHSQDEVIPCWYRSALVTAIVVGKRPLQVLASCACMRPSHSMGRT